MRFAEIIKRLQENINDFRLRSLNVCYLKIHVLAMHGILITHTGLL